MKQTIMIIIAFMLLSTAADAQTYVSGGIYSDATWFKANSPYIVTDNIVVFPNVTLTIEPGVTVKFADGKSIEIRQANLIALGTAFDSITITSNSNNPHLGIYQGIVFTFPYKAKVEYCNFKYASKALNTPGGPGLDSLKHSFFYMN